MKKQILLAFAAMLITAITFGQAPKKMSYQSVIRDAANALVASQQVGIRVQIIQGTEFGSAKYVETHKVTTNANGLATMEIGTGTVVSGDFDNIDWTDGPYFIKTETDPTGGSSYTLTTLSEMMSVPYALLAEKATLADSVAKAATLDQAYHSGSTGTGRTIKADEGALLIEGTDGIQVIGGYGIGAEVIDYLPQTRRSRMFFNPKTSSFRVGFIDTKNWDKDSIGTFSFATGYNTLASGASSTAMGRGSKASGSGSAAIGYQNEASGNYSSAMGRDSKASAEGSAAIGYQNEASGNYSSAMGRDSKAKGIGSAAIGYQNEASGDYSTAMGRSSNAIGENSVAIGYQNEAIGSYSTAMGRDSKASGSGSTAIGSSNEATETYATALGGSSKANGIHSIAIGYDNKATESDATAMGSQASALGSAATAIGYRSSASGTNAIAFGTDAIAENGGFAIGYNTKATGSKSIAIGNVSRSTGKYSTAIGNHTSASADSATALGSNTTASAKGSTAMGSSTLASGETSFAIGRKTVASGASSTAMGSATNAEGFASTAMGSKTTASGQWSTALGSGTHASGNTSTAIGYGSIADGSYSFAMGQYSKATGFASAAMGLVAEASGYNSFATGHQTKASGKNSFTGGEKSSASGENSIALGNRSIVWGANSAAIGSNIWVKGSGSIYLADNSRDENTVDTRVSNNTFYGRFDNGYYLYTDPTDSYIGARLAGGANSWSVISDSAKKENFLPVDGKDFLNKIADMKLTSWNYKGQDPKEFRHYGPMAQDFYNAFGKDKFGRIGNDTTIASADFTGVNFVAIQALVKENKELKEKLSGVNNEVALLKSKNVENEAIVKAMENKIQSINQLNTSTIKVLQAQFENLTKDLKNFKKYAAMQKEMMPVAKK